MNRMPHQSRLLLSAICVTIAGGLWACRSDDRLEESENVPTLESSGFFGRGESGPDEDVSEPDAEDDTATDDIEEDAEPVEVCVPEPPPEAMARAGEIVEEVFLTPGGRGVSTPGDAVEVRGFPSSATLTPDGKTAYVVSNSRTQRRLQVIDVASATLLQDLNMPDVFHGAALDAAQSRLYVSGGPNRTVNRLDIEEDGTVTLVDSPPVGAYVSGLALNADATRLFVGSFDTHRVFEFDTAQLGADATPVATYRTAATVWDLLYLEDSGELVVSTLAGDGLQVIDPAEGTISERIRLGQSPMGMVRASSGMIYVSLAGTDEVVAVDPSSWEVSARGRVTGDTLSDAEGEPLLRSNPNSVALSSDESRLYVSRGADNAVGVLNTSDLSFEGAFPTAWYPTSVTLVPGSDVLVVTEGRGFGAIDADGNSPRALTDGNVTIVDMASLDLGETSQQVDDNFQRPLDVFPFECDGFFPIPTRPGQESPIEHVILVVKENKTFDCVFGDLDLDVDVDPTLVRWGEEITPNQHALAREFNISDNFYVEAENSDMGHVVLTAGYLNEFFERMWIETKHGAIAFNGYQVREEVTPENGNIFTQMMNHGIDIQIYGEIVGAFAEAEDGSVPFDHSDWGYPGGPVYNMAERDSERAEYVVEQIEAGNLAQFTFMLLPNDHTGGTAPGNPTPESEVADNDEGVGILIEGLSRSEYWDKTVVIITEDDPQGCGDHVHPLRSYILIVSPWARRNYVSHVNYSFQSIFATIFRILDVPPIGRHDASVSPMWDFFTGTPDFTPFEHIPRRVAEEKIRDLDTPGARASMGMDFRGPDRNENLGIVLDAYRLWRMGEISRDEAQRRIDENIRTLPGGVLGDPESLEEYYEELEEEAEEERNAFDQSFARYGAWLRERGQAVPVLHGAPLDEATIDAVMDSRIPIDQLNWIPRD